MRTGAILWAIRHKPTNTYLPQLNIGRGWTRIDVDGFLPFTMVPRLFSSKSGAQKALNCWLRGPWEAVKESDYDDWSGRSYSYTVGGAPPVESPADRVRGDMEVVSVRMEVR